MSAAVSLPEPLVLVHRGHDDEIVAYACPKCGTIYTPGMFGDGPSSIEYASRTAQEHCEPRYCGCGSIVEKGRVRCNACWSRDQTERDRKKYEIAEKVQEKDYGDPVFWDGHEGSMGDGYFSDTYEVHDYCESEGIDLPSYVWACTSVPLEIRTDQILEYAFEEHYEGARDMLVEGAEKELEDLLSSWCEKQNILSWQPDYRHAVLLRKESD